MDSDLWVEVWSWMIHHERSQQQLNRFTSTKIHICFGSVGFPDSSVGKESTCNAEDPGSTPGLGRSSGEGIGCLLQYSWASLVAQMVKNLPAMWETWVLSLGWEDPLEKRKATHSSILAWENSMDCIVHGVAKSRTWLGDFHFGSAGPIPDITCQWDWYCWRLWMLEAELGREKDKVSSTQDRISNFLLRCQIL